jgi:hypothetical protein
VLQTLAQAAADNLGSTPPSTLAGVVVGLIWFVIFGCVAVYLHFDMSPEYDSKPTAVIGWAFVSTVALVALAGLAYAVYAVVLGVSG